MNENVLSEVGAMLLIILGFAICTMLFAALVIVVLRKIEKVESKTHKTRKYGSL